MTARLSGHFSIFGKVWFSLCSSLFWELRDNGVVKIATLTLKPRSHVRILKYRTWAISAQKLLCTKFADPVYSGFLFSNQPIKIIDLKVTKKNCKTG